MEHIHILAMTFDIPIYYIGDDCKEYGVDSQTNIDKVQRGEVGRPFVECPTQTIAADESHNAYFYSNQIDACKKAEHA